MENQDGMERIKQMANILDIPYDEIRRADFRETEIISRQLMSHIKDIQVTIRPDGIQFNNSCITLFDNVNYVLLGIDKVQKWLVVNECGRDDIDGQRWCKTKNDKRETRKITGKLNSDRIYRMMGWNKGYYYKVLGTLALQEDEEDEPYLLFDLTKYDQYALTEKGRAAAGIEDSDVGDDELAKIRRAEEMAAQEKAEAEARGSKPKRKRKHLIGGLADENSFGTPRKKHKSRLEMSKLQIENINQMSFDDFAL